MFKFITFTFLVIGFSTHAMAETFSSPSVAVSAKRLNGEDWRLRSKNLDRSQKAVPYKREYAIDVAMLYEQADLSSVTRVADYKTIQKYFEKTRDYRFMEDPYVDEPFLRRISWMYPDDGCFARASLVNRFLEEWSETPLTKIYVFGNLVIKSPNAPGDGLLEWWYHVANIVTDGNAVYVLDPAVDPSRPLKLLEWMGRMNDPFLALAVCSPNTYTPYSDCTAPNLHEQTTMVDDQIGFFPFERNRITLLGRDWTKELGDSPPWLQPKRKVKRPRR